MKPIQYQPQLHPQMGMWIDLQGGAMSLSTVQSDFAQIAALGANTVRLVAHCASGTFDIGSGVTPSATQLAQLTSVLSAARDAGLNVWLVVFDHYPSSAFVVADSQAWLTAIVGAFPSNHTVVVCELQNEVGSTMTNASAFASWLPQMIPTARALLPGVALTVSVFGAPGSGKDGADSLRWLIGTCLGGQAGLLDLYSIHNYSSWGQVEAASSYYAACRALLGGASGTPFYIGEYGFSTSYSDTAKISAQCPNTLSYREAHQEYNLRQTLYLCQQLGSGGPLPWMLYDIPGVHDETAWPTATQSAAASAFTLNQVVKWCYAWSTSQGDTNCFGITPQSVTISASGNKVTVPAVTIPFGATGFKLYVNTANGNNTYNLYAQQTGLLGTGTAQTAPVDITGFATSGTLPTGSNVSAPLSYRGQLPAEYGFGLIRHSDEPNPGAFKPAATTLQNLWTNSQALSTSWNGDLEATAVADFNNVTQWPPCWRYAGNGGNMSVALTTSNPHGGTQCLSISQGWNTSGSTQFPVTSVVPFVGLIDPTKTYTASCWINATSVPAGFSVRANISWWGPTLNFVANTTYVNLSAANAGWTQYSTSLKPPAGATSLTLSFGFGVPANTAQGSAAGQFYLDDVTFSIA